jgi:hypothetical protein
VSTNDPKDPAEERRQKLQALRDRRVESGRRPAPSEGAGQAAGGAGEGRRRFGGGAGGGGAGGGGGGGDQQGRRAQLAQALKNPEKRKELMQRFPQLRKAMEQRMQGGSAGGAGGGPGARAGGRMGGGAGARIPGAGAGARMAGGGRLSGGAAPSDAGASSAGSEALSEQVKALERRVAELTDTVQKTRAELEDAKRVRNAPPPAAAAPAVRSGSAAKTKLASLKKGSSKK